MHRAVLPAVVAVSGATTDIVGTSNQAEPCNCSGSWVAIKREYWQLFHPDVDIAGVLDCLSAQSCGASPELHVASLLLGGEHVQCSEERLPMIDARVCPAGMMHYMVLCALQMWLRRKFRQSALYFEHGLGFLALSLGCLEGSDWPLWPGQVLRNYRGFLRAAFPPGKLRSELRAAPPGGASAAAPSTYAAVGPVVNHSAFRWRTGPRAGLRCPPPGFADDPAPARPQLVLCAVPLVWPGERAAAEAIVDTYGRACAELVFFVAAPDGGAARDASATLRGLYPRARVVDLAARWPHIVRDSDDALPSRGRKLVSGANQKDLLLFAHLASTPGFDWVCRVETDSYFAPANFQRFVAGRGLSASAPWFLGSVSYWHMHFEPRIVFNEQVQCLSRASVLQLAQVVVRAPVVPVASYTQCEIAPGHRGDLLLALCLAEANITPFPDIADPWGREYFLNYRMEDIGLYAPDEAYGSEMEDPRRFTTNAAMHWRGKAHVFMPCLGHNKFWASPFPVSFHDYKNPEALRAVHEVFAGRQRCAACPEGYSPRLAEPGA